MTVTQPAVPARSASPAAPGRRPGRPARVLALAVGALLTAACVGYGCLTLIALVARQHRTFDSGFAASSVRAVDVRTDGVGAAVVGGVAPGGRATVHAAVDFSWGKPNYSAVVDADGTLRVRVHCSSSAPVGCGGRTTVAVPSRVRVVVSSADGRVRAEHIDGPVDLHSDDGRVRASDVSGDLRMTSGDGGVAGDRLRSARVTASSSDGGVSLGFAVAPTSVNARSSDGGVHVRVPDRSGPYAVDAATSDGSTRTDVRTDPRASRTIRVHSDDGGVGVGYGD